MRAALGGRLFISASTVLTSFSCDAGFPAAGGWFTRFYTAHAKWDVAVAPAFRSFVGDEARATALYVFEHSLIPGLLATEDYSRAVLSRHVGVTAEQVAARVAARMARQAILDREDPPLLWAVIDDAATIVAVSVRFRWLQAEAMPAAASQAFMERMAEQWTQAAPGGARRLTPVPAAGSASK
jgi:hypothetical protein